MRRQAQHERALRFHPTPLILSLSKDAALRYRQTVAFWTYILRCSDGTYYVGHTDNFDQRMAQHERGAVGGYTAKRRPVTYLWSEQFPTRDEAFAAERKLKGWSRAKKEALMAGDWQLVSSLARNRIVRGDRSAQHPSTGSG